MRQPKALFLLFFVEMWERFSYYGMRVLLVLFMIQKLHMSDSQAFALFALYTGLVEMGALLGAVIADRILGLRPSIFLGGALIALGHTCLTWEHGLPPFFLGLALIVTGSSLFISNIKAYLGLFYTPDDPRREAGFTLFYTGINLGGFLATLLCGVVGQTFGWHWGFGLAAAGMGLGLCALFAFKKVLEGKGEAPKGVTYPWKIGGVLALLSTPFAVAYCLQRPQFVTPLLPFVWAPALWYVAKKLKGASKEMQRGVFAFFGMLALFILFFTFEELMGSLLLLYCERFVDRTVGNVRIPSAVILSINPLTVIVVGAWMAKAQSVVHCGRGPLKSMALSLALLGGSFVLLAAGAVWGTSIWLVALSFSIIAAAELLMAPVVFAHAAKIAPSSMKGGLMSLVVMGFSTASYLSGSLGQLFTFFREKNMQISDSQFYALFFFSSALVIIFVAMGAFRISSWEMAFEE